MIISWLGRKRSIFSVSVNCRAEIWRHRAYFLYGRKASSSMQLLNWLRTSAKTNQIILLRSKTTTTKGPASEDELPQPLTIILYIITYCAAETTICCIVILKMNARKIWFLYCCSICQRFKHGYKKEEKNEDVSRIILKMKAFFLCAWQLGVGFWLLIICRFSS